MYLEFVKIGFFFERERILEVINAPCQSLIVGLLGTAITPKCQGSSQHGDHRQGTKCFVVLCFHVNFFFFFFTWSSYFETNFVCVHRPC